MPRRMSRTTIMAPDDLLDRLRAIAKEEGISLGEVIRQGLEWRARLRRRPPTFIGRIAAGEPDHDTASRDEEVILEYLRSRDAGL
jgi:hypothetical protein